MEEAFRGHADHGEVAPVQESGEGGGRGSAQPQEEPEGVPLVPCPEALGEVGLVDVSGGDEFLDPVDGSGEPGGSEVGLEAVSANGRTRRRGRAVHRIGCRGFDCRGQLPDSDFGPLAGRLAAIGKASGREHDPFPLQVDGHRGIEQAQPEIGEAVLFVRSRGRIEGRVHQHPELVPEISHGSRRKGGGPVRLREPEAPQNLPEQGKGRSPLATPVLPGQDRPVSAGSEEGERMDGADAEPGEGPHTGASWVPAAVQDPPGAAGPAQPGVQRRRVGGKGQGPAEHGFNLHPPARTGRVGDGEP